MRNYPPVEKNEPAPAEQKLIPVNGFQQIVDMLKVADPQFRDSLLRRLAARDSNLANSLWKAFLD